jgi:hypothetical protein
VENGSKKIGEKTDVAARLFDYSVFRFGIFKTLNTSHECLSLHSVRILSADVIK